VSARTGLRDAHLHFAEHGEALGSVDLSDCVSVDQCLERAHGACAEKRALRGDWVVCRGARPGGWREGRFPTRAELDDVCAGMALVVRSFDHHSASADSVALERAGLAEGAHPEMDDAGHVWEGAYRRLLEAIPARTDEEERRCALEAQRDLMGQGFVLAHDMFATERFARTLVELDRSGALEMGVACFAPPAEIDAVRAIVGDAGSARVAFGGLKLFIDGTLSGRTAHMLEPYADPLPGAPRGSALLDDDEILAHFERAEAERFGVAIHAIGDGAVRRILNLDERCAERLGRAPTFTLRLEHAQFVHPSDIERIARAVATGRQMIVSVQPSHLLTDIESVRTHVPGAESRAFPLRSVVEALAGAGVDPAAHVELGSDTPVVRPLPDDTILAACTRRRAGMDASEALNPSERVDEEVAWSLYRAPAQPS
jgi:predicted amidohydrolase YtcJ